jgi:uncharacterized SAM-binding protein YcdF (DUF218 family)
MPRPSLTLAARALGLLTVALFLATAFTPLPNAAAHWLAVPGRVEPADAIVVLGGGMYPDGTLSNSSLRRALHGIVLVRRGLAPRLVLLGGAPRHWKTEAQARVELAQAMGVSDQDIVVPGGATTTRDEALRVREALEPLGARTILLVTNAQHMRRAQRLFERAGFTVLPAPAEEFTAAAAAPGDRLALAQRVLQEVIARLYYRAAGYL